MNEEDLKNSFIKELTTRPEEFRTTSSFTYNLYNPTNLLLIKVKQKFNVLTTTVLDDESSITLFNNDSGYFDISYKDKRYFQTLQFFDLEFALTILEAIEKCSSISELLDYLDV